MLRTAAPQAATATPTTTKIGAPRGQEKNCKTVTFHKGKRNAKTVRLCDRGPGKPAKRKAGHAAARAACRKGGAKGKRGMAKFRAKQFVACR